MNRLSDAWVGAIVLLVLGLIGAGAWLWVTDSDPLVVPRQDAAASAAPVGTPVESSRAEVDGTRLRVSYGGSACQVSNDIRVEESPERVVVTVYVVDSSRMCTLRLVEYELRAELSTPLADRPLFDGACLGDATTPNDPDCRRSTG